MELAFLWFISISKEIFALVLNSYESYCIHLSKSPSSVRSSIVKRIFSKTYSAYFKLTFYKFSGTSSSLNVYSSDRWSISLIFLLRHAITVKIDLLSSHEKTSNLIPSGNHSFCYKLRSVIEVNLSILI